ncbi:MAG: ATP-binding protein [Cytophagales bacterium]
MKKYCINVANSIRGIFSFFLNLGLDYQLLNRQQTKTIKLSNVVHLMVAFMLVSVGFFFYFIGAKELFVLNLCWAVANISCLVLNRYKKFEISKIIFIVSVHIYSLISTFVLNIVELGICVLMATTAATLFMYKTSNYFKIAIFFLLTVINYLIIKFSPERFDFSIHYSQEIQSAIEILGFLFSCSTLIIIIYTERFINAQNEHFLIREIRQRKKIEKALTDAKMNSDKSILVKTDFLSTISYHIRTPLNAILGLSNLLILESPKKNQIPKLSVLKNSTDGLIRLIDNLLDFNKIESGDINIYTNEFQIRDLVENICKSYLTKAEEKGTKFTVSIDKDIPKKLIGDEIKISQIVSNLVSNALKFTEQGSVQLSIKLKHISNDCASVHFSISDTGIGIAKEKLKYIFENFATNLATNGRNYTTSGSGLGLSISKRLAEVLGSDIYVESNLGKGTHFYFTLNLKIFEENIVPEQADQAKKRLLNKINILLVDDNQMNTLVAESFLKRWNANVDTTADGISAVEMAKEKRYDIILMDLQLPQISGFEATRQIRLFNEHVAILAITAENYGFANENFKLLGIDDVLLKPFYPNDLFAKIEGLIGNMLE